MSKVYKLGQLPDWATKVERVADAIVKQATNDLLNSIQVAPGIVRGGSRRRGVIPLMDGAIAASLQSTLHGSTAISGIESHVMVIAQMKAGDVASFSWGGSTAPHAMANHYGTKRMVGTFWVDVAANQWPRFVNTAVVKAWRELQ